MNRQKHHSSVMRLHVSSVSIRQPRLQKLCCPFLRCLPTLLVIIAQLLAMAITKRIGFLGSGQMAEALARGMIAKGVVTSDQLHCSDPNPERLRVFTSFGATAHETNTEVRAPRVCAFSP